MLFTDKAKEKHEYGILICEQCGLRFFEANGGDEYASVDETGLCISCKNEIDVKII